MAVSRKTPDTAIALLEPADALPDVSLVAISGGDAFLRGLARARLRAPLLAADESGASESVFAGKRLAWADVADALTSVSLFSTTRRLVFVEDADEFVSAHRPALERWAERPATAGLLVLLVDRWPGNTKLAKLVAAHGVHVDCKAPSGAALPRWVVACAKLRHRARISNSAAEQMVERVGDELGLLDQELAKLATLAGDDPISDDLVEANVGSWRTQTTWNMIDAAVAGDADQALAQIDQLLAAGEHPIAILGQLGSTLRRFAAAARSLVDARRRRQNASVRQALLDAGFKSFIVAKAEGQLRQLGPQRAVELNRWVVETDLALKGASALPPRVVLEQLVVRLARSLRPASAKPRPR